MALALVSVPGFNRPRRSASGDLRTKLQPNPPLQITIRLPGFKSELWPLHSQLLGPSLLISFPPLIDMLKFSGYPRVGEVKCLLKVSPLSPYPERSEAFQGRDASPNTGAAER